MRPECTREFYGISDFVLYLRDDLLRAPMRRKRRDIRPLEAGSKLVFFASYERKLCDRKRKFFVKNMIEMKYYISN